MSDLMLEQVKQLAVNLSTLEKTHLVEWLNATLEHDLAETIHEETPSTWGQEVVALLTSSDVGIDELEEIPDAAEWVRNLRRQADRF